MMDTHTQNLGGKRQGAGRPLKTSGVRTKASKLVDGALQALDDVARNAVDPLARVQAAKALVDFSLGGKQ